MSGASRAASAAGPGDVALPPAADGVDRQLDGLVRDSTRALESMDALPTASHAEVYSSIATSLGAALTDLEPR